MKPGNLHYGWIVIFMGMLTTIAAHGFGRMAYTLLLPAMKDGLSFDYTQLGLLGTGNFVGYLSMAIIGGFLAARFGTRIVITLALVLLGATLILTGLAHSFHFALGMRFLTGLGNGAAYVPAMALGSAWFAMNRRGFATGIVSGGIGAGTLISGLLVPPILTAYGAEGWRHAWFILGGIALVIAAVVCVLVRSRPEEKGLAPVGAQNTAALPAGPAGPKVSALQWSSVYRKGAVWYLGLVYFFYGASYIIYMTFFAAYLVKEMGATPAYAGGLWAMVGALSTFCGVIWGAISDRLGRSRGAALAYFVLAAAYAVFALVKAPPGFYLSAVLFGLSAWSIPTIMAAAAGDFVGPRLAPAGLGFITLFFGIGQALAPAFGGYLADLSGSFTLPFLVAAGISLAGTAASLFLKKPAGLQTDSGTS
ncbi:MAG: MFS transporter [Desulfobacterales bacterium]|jgi:MFS family permease|nr:MFS transporter [Desulfobacterales bacterium]